jgi:hypothetical protein
MSDRPERVEVSLDVSGSVGERGVDLCPHIVITLYGNFYNSSQTIEIKPDAATKLAADLRDLLATVDHIMAPATEEEPRNTD